MPHAECPWCHRTVEVRLTWGPEPVYDDHDSHPLLRALCKGSRQVASLHDVVEEVTEDEMAEVYRSLGVSEHSTPDHPTAIFQHPSEQA